MSRIHWFACSFQCNSAENHYLRYSMILPVSSLTLFLFPDFSLFLGIITTNKFFSFQFGLVGHGELVRFIHAQVDDN